MCVAIPMKVVEIKDNIAICEYENVKYKARIDLVKDLIKVGDYVIIHTGFVLQKLDIQDALETIKIYKEMKNLIS